MTALDIIKAIAKGAGVSEFAAIQALRDHDAAVKAQVLASKERRETIATRALQGLLCSGRMNPPEAFAKEAVQLADCLIAELDK
ncbi:hypothetical protein [Paraburkholderia atlantica]|uniref:hypothetical protein n=1 Tax=Paraburkholderia atlantica TaxID=2654982 RepID=UPI003D1C865C